MRDGIIYDCPNANCRTPIYTGKCSKICIERYKKEIGIKPQTNADRIRAMSDEELAMIIMCPYGIEDDLCNKRTDRLTCCVQWLKLPAEEGTE